MDFLEKRFYSCRSQWQRDLRCGSAVACLLRLWFRIPPGAWMFACCECCVLSGRGLCNELIARPGESYRLWCVVVCDLETSWKRRPWPTGGVLRQKQKHILLLLGFEVRTDLPVPKTLPWLLSRLLYICMPYDFNSVTQFTDFHVSVFF